MTTVRRNPKQPHSPSEIARPAVTVRVQAFGTLTIDVAGTRLGRGADIVQAVLLFLVSAPGMQLRRESIIDRLWPGSPEKRQRGNLRQVLYKLRLMGVDVEMTGDLVVLDGRQIEATFSVHRDAATFDAQVVKGHEPFGPYLLGFDCSASVALEAWVEGERERAHSDARRVLAQALRTRHATADWVAAEPLARWLLQFDPLNEAATLVMAECLVISGAKYEAIRLLDRYMSELGPGAEDLRIPATTLRRRIASPTARRISFAPTERHFVGRESVMADLTLCMRRARFHDGTATLLHGSAGMGKTRVLNELTKVALIEGVRDVRASCRESDVTRPLSVFLDVVPELLQMPGALGCAPESLQALRRFTNEDAGNVDRANVPGVLNMPLAAGLRRAVVDLLMAVSEERPTLLTIEDVHWLDSASWEVMVDLISRIGQCRVCLIMTSRLPHARPTAPERVPIELSIKALLPLSTTSCLELAHAIGEDLSARIDEDLGAWFVHTCEGVPLFLRSLVNHWIETGDAGGIPPTLLGVIGQRLQSLSSDALYVLQTVALLGRHANLGMIESVLEMPYFRIVSAIDDLHKAGAFDSDDEGVIVCHELIGRLAVDNLGRNARRALHKRIAEVMLKAELQTGVSPITCSDRLSHLFAAGEKAQFIEASALAIRALLDAGHSYHALSVADATLHEVSDENEKRRAILTLQSEALYDCGEFARLLSHPSSPVSVDHGLKDLERIDAEIVVRWLDSAAHAAVGSQALDLAAAATLIAESMKHSPSVRYFAATVAIRTASNACEPEIAARAYSAGKLACAELDTPGVRREGLDMLFHTGFGDWKIALSAADTLLASSYSVLNLKERLTTQLHVAFCFRYGGRILEATSLLESIHHVAIAENFATSMYHTSFRLAYLWLDLGDIDLAEYWWREYERVAPMEREPLAAALFHVIGVRIAVFRRDLGTAQYHHERSLTLLPPDGHPTRHGTVLAGQLAIGRLAMDSVAVGQALPIAMAVFQKTRTHLGQSFLASEICLSMSFMGDKAGARELLTTFVAEDRRELSPMPAYLESLVESLLEAANTVTLPVRPAI